ncbi:hypothetical protein BN1095_6650001 [Clostridioides difficile]|uniref:Uncharacterized protein n=1 Tax=Clostridioides difficile TaxID=1496 RepID=A0A069B1H3_CLODI|nr:hypothetical protein BN1095_6650001 [Clostridioides difficile]
MTALVQIKQNTGNNDRRQYQTEEKTGQTFSGLGKFVHKHTLMCFRRH